MPINEQEPVGEVLRLEALGGLHVEGGPFSRPQNSFEVLSNFELQRTGCIRHARGFRLYNDNEYSAPVVAIRSYVREPNNSTTEVLVGVCRDGSLFDLDSGTLLADFGIDIGIPFVAILPMFTKDSVADPTNGAVVQQFIIAPEGAFPSRWDGNGGVVPLGVSAPDGVVSVKGFSYVPNTAPDPGKHNFTTILASRRYVYTYWNPETKHESSLSLSGPTAVIGQGGYVIEEARWYLSAKLQLPAAAPAYGDGYTHRRLYATRDGGSEYFLVEELWDVNGSLITDSDGAFEGTHTFVFDGIVLDGNVAEREYKSFPNGVLFPGTLVETEARSMFVNLVDSTDVTETSNNPPPRCSGIGAVYQNRLWLASADEPNKIWFSRVGDYQSFSGDNFFQFLSDDADPIVGLQMEFESLIVQRRKKLSRITGTDFTNFAVTHLEQGLGAIGKRLSANGAGKAFYLSQEGLFSFAMDSPNFESPQLKPLFQSFNISETGERMAMVEDARNGIIYFGLRTAYFRTDSKEGDGNANDGQEEDILVGMDVSEQSPFFILRGGPLESQLFTLDQIQLGTEQFVFAGTGDRKVYRVGLGTGFEVAVAVTQQLIGKMANKRKVFRYLKLDDIAGDPKLTINGFKVSFSVDGKPFRTERKLRRHTAIGLVGTTLQIRFRHVGEFFVEENEPWPTLSNFSVEFVEIGEAR